MQTTPQALIDDYTARGWWGRETLDSLLRRAVAECPERPALVDPPNRPDIAGGNPTRLSWAQLESRVEGLATALHATGLRADDIAVVQLPNIAELALAYLALARLGAIVSPVPVQYGLHELGAIQSELSARAFLSLGSFKGRDLLRERAEAFPGCLLYGLGSPSAANCIDLDTSAPLPPWMIEGYEKRHGIAILNNFGSNEGMCLASGPRDVPDPALRGELFPRFGVAGYEWSNRAAAMTSTRLVDPETGERIEEPGVPGELLVKGPTLFDGYWKAPQANAEVFTQDGYFRTGDLFEIAGPPDDPRYYRFVGRCKDIIVRGGMNVSPAELDGLLAGHPDLADAAVFGAPDPVLGERIAVAVVVKPGHRVVLDDIVAFLKEKDVAVFKLPELLHVFPELPRNPLEKVLRHELLAQTASDSKQIA